MAIKFINMLTHPPLHFPFNNIISKIKEVNKKGYWEILNIMNVIVLTKNYNN